MCCAGLCLVAQLCLSLCDPIDGSSPGSSFQNSPGNNTRVDYHIFCLTVLYVILHLGTAPSAVQKLLHPTGTWTLFLSTSLPLVGARSLCLYSSTPVQAKLHLNVLFTPLWFSFCWDVATPWMPSPLSSDEALLLHTKPPLCSYVLLIFFWL